MELFARKCHNCDCGMNTGHLWESTYTFCNADCLIEWLFLEETCFYTEWDVENDSDGEVYDEKGKTWILKPKKDKNERDNKTT